MPTVGPHRRGASDSLLMRNPIWNVGPCLCVPMTMRSIALSAAERAKRGGE